MKIKAMFQKPIDRDLKGVIKVGQDDEANIYQELDEYVVTGELTDHFRDFFAAYKRGLNEPTDKMGVWISGFFGSGKSHFLKILSYLLQNRTVNGRQALDFFIDDGKITDSAIIEDMRAAGNIPADVILFNIDAKSEAGAKQNKEAIVEVFIKVFNEMQGYCCAIPFLADLERWLDEEGRFAAFQEDFAALSGQTWAEKRDDFYFIQDQVAQTLAKCGAMSLEAARNWCSGAQENYSLTIEGFAALIGRYCQKSGRRVVFMVDEIGQYIGEDTNLMLNLQTITEQLGIVCQGQAWVIVTSQEDIDSLVAVKGKDFSKIQGRFDTRLSLSSADVAEVIRQRILAKNPTAEQTLTLLYRQKEAVIKNLLTFSDEVEKKLYNDEGDFAAVYPFIPYQFALLGQVLTAIRLHGSNGKHLAEGERSMLKVFWEAAGQYKEEDAGILVPFNTFYSALHQFVDHTHQIVIIQAGSNQKLEPFDVALLKVLFMLRYVKEIKCDADNLTTLMVDHIDADRIALRKKVEAALARLVTQTLVTQSGDVYQFLTNEERDIEIAIKKETVSTDEITSKAAEIIFSALLPDKKYRYNNRYQFPYSRSIDDRPYGEIKSHDLALNLITPYHDAYQESSQLQMRSAQGEIVIRLADGLYLNEIHGMLQIEKYLRQNSSTLNETIKRHKQEERAQKGNRAAILLTEAIKNADIYLAGQQADIAAKAPADRINDALARAVTITYSKLSYMTFAPSEDDVLQLLKSADELFADASDTLACPLALDAAWELIARHHQQKTPLSRKAWQDKLASAPYGFIDLDCQWLLAALLKQNKITLKLNHTMLSPATLSAKEIFSYLSKKEYGDKLLLEPRERIKPALLNKTREIMQALFDQIASGDGEDQLMSRFIAASEHMSGRIDDIGNEYRIEPRFPGQKILTDGQKLLKEICECKSPAEFYHFIAHYEDNLLDFAEDSANIFAFFNGKQNQIFAAALRALDLYQGNKDWIEDEHLRQIAQAMQEIADAAAPYGRIHLLPDLTKQFNDSYAELLETTSQEPLQLLQEARDNVFAELKGKLCHDELKDNFISLFAHMSEKIQESNTLAQLQNFDRQINSLKIKCLNSIVDEEKAMRTELAQKAVPRSVSPASATATVAAPAPVMKKHKSISIKEISPDSTWQLETLADVERYVGQLKEQLVRALEDDTVIHVEF